MPRLTRLCLLTLLCACADRTGYGAQWCSRFCGDASSADCATECPPDASVGGEPDASVLDSGAPGDAGRDAEQPDAGADAGRPADAGEDDGGAVGPDAGASPTDGGGQDAGTAISATLFLDTQSGAGTLSAGACELVHIGLRTLDGALAPGKLYVRSSNPSVWLGSAAGGTCEGPSLSPDTMLTTSATAPFALLVRRDSGGTALITIEERPGLSEAFSLTFGGRLNLASADPTALCSSWELRVTSIDTFRAPVVIELPEAIDAGPGVAFSESTCTERAQLVIPVDGGTTTFFMPYGTVFTLTPASAWVAAVSGSATPVIPFIGTKCFAGFDCVSRTCSGQLCSCAATATPCLNAAECCSQQCDNKRGCQ
jgi:hypothetical protein